MTGSATCSNMMWSVMDGPSPDTNVQFFILRHDLHKLPRLGSNLPLSCLSFPEHWDHSHSITCSAPVFKQTTMPMVFQATEHKPTCTIGPLNKKACVWGLRALPCAAPPSGVEKITGSEGTRTQPVPSIFPAASQLQLSPFEVISDPIFLSLFKHVQPNILHTPVISGHNVTDCFPMT